MGPVGLAPSLVLASYSTLPSALVRRPISTSMGLDKTDCTQSWRRLRLSVEYIFVCSIY